MAAPKNLMSLPSLVFHYGGSGQAATMFCVADGSHSMFEPEEMGGKRCWGTSSGWIVSCDLATSASFLWNPSAPDGSDKISLPPMTQPPPAGSSCELSGSPTDAGGCTVVLSEAGENTVLRYCHVGAPAWTRHEYDIGGVVSPVFPDAKRFVFHIASCRGRFYYLNTSTKLGVIDFSSTAGPPEFSVLPVKELEPLRDPGRGSWVQGLARPVNIDGDLYMVCVVYHGFDVNNAVDVGIYRMDFAQNEFFRVDSIGDRAVVACNWVGGWCPATQFGMIPNSVYWMSPLDKRLHIFDIETRTEILLNPCKGVAEPYHGPFWMIPTHP